MRRHAIVWQALLFVIIGMTLRIPAFADEAKNPIDLWLEKALAKNHSTMGMRKATLKAREMWDADMNKTYQRLMNTLKPARRKALVKSQKTWLAFRDAEFNTDLVIIGSRQGTMWTLVTDDRALQIVKERALQLQGYDELINEKH
jgi:uncharacterized protein YecT (DUF1311 family)